MLRIFLLFFLQLFTLNLFSQTQNWRIEYDSAKAEFIKGRPEVTALWLENFLPKYKVNLKDTTQYFEMIHLLGRCFMKMSKRNDAEKLFKEDITYYQLHPTEISKSTYTTSIIYLGYLYYEKREFDKSETYFEEGLKLKKAALGEDHPQYCLLLENLAKVNFAQKDFKRADSIYNSVLTIKRDLYGDNSSEIASTLTDFATSYRRLGKLKEAEPIYQQVISIRKQIHGERSAEYVDACTNLANLYLQQGRFDLAEPLFTKILEASKELFTPQDIQYTTAISNKALLYEKMSRFADAEKLYQEVLSIREETLGMNNFDYTNALLSLANLYKITSDYRKSELFYKSALSIYEVIIGEKHETYIGTLVNLAGLYRSLGMLTKAEPLYLKALKIYKETVGDHTLSYANLLNNIALYYDETGNYETAENYYKKALEITKDLIGDNHYKYGITLNNLATLYKNTGHFDQAEPLYLQYAKICKEQLGEKNIEYATSLNNLAVLYEAMGRYDEAEPLYEETVKIIKHLYGTQNPFYAEAINNLGGLYRSQKKLSEAKKLFEEALEITKNILGEKHHTYALILNNLALLQQDRKDFSQSEKLFVENNQKIKDALGNKHPNYAASINNLAGLYEHTGRYDDALKLYSEALDILQSSVGERHHLTTFTYSALARVYTVMNNYDEADKMWEKSIDNYLFEIRTFFPTMSEKEKGQFYQTLKEEFEIFNSYALLRSKTNPSILSRMYDNQLATKALLLTSTNKMKHTILSSKDSSIVRMFKQWLSEKEVLSKLYTISQDELQNQHIKLDSIEHKANELERQLSLKSEVFKSNEVSFKSWKDVRKNLETDEAAMEIIRFQKYKFDSAGVYVDSIYYACLVIKNSTTDNPELIVLKDGKKMEGKLLAIYKNSIKFKLTDKSSYDAYWRPIQQHLVGIKKVDISPDGVYNQINFNTLRNNENNLFVLETYDLKLVTNTKDLIKNKQVINIKKSISLFGNPDYAYSPEPIIDSLQEEDVESLLNPLQGTEEEVNEINGEVMAHRWNSKVYTGKEANETNLKSIKSPKVLHIATHGFFEKDIAGNKESNRSAGTENPLLRSGLMFAGASISLYNKENHVFNSDKIEEKHEDGILTAYEAMNLNLDHTDLVVLSACETGLGQVKNGEGVYGLQRAFIIAGAKSVILSLWKVNDETTQKLMSYFYEEWLKTENKNIAFKKAQTRLKSEYKDPYYWGAFVIVQ